MSSEELIAAIEQADGYWVDEIILALRRRYLALYPDTEIYFVSVPRNDPAERRRILETVLKAAQK